MADETEQGWERRRAQYHTSVSVGNMGWVARLTGPCLPDEGVTVRNQSRDDLLGMARLEIPEQELMKALGDDYAGYDINLEYDLRAHWTVFQHAKVARFRADLDYTTHGRRAAAMSLGRGRTLAQVAKSMGVSTLEVSRLLAWKPRPVQLDLPRRASGPRHWLKERAGPYLGYAARTPYRQARVLAAEAVRRAWNRGSRPES